MQIEIRRGFKTETYKQISINFQNSQEVLDLFKPRKYNVKESSEHFRVDAKDSNGSFVSYGCFLDIDNSNPDNRYLSYEDALFDLGMMNLNHVGYKSFSSNKNGNKDRFRFFIPWERPCPAALHAKSVEKLTKLLDWFSIIDTASMQYRHVMFAPGFPPNGSEESVGVTLFNTGKNAPIASLKEFSKEDKKEILNSAPTKRLEVDKGSTIYRYMELVSIEEAIEKYASDVYKKTAEDGRYLWKGSKSGIPGAVIYRNDGPNSLGRLWSWHEEDPFSLMFMSSYDILLQFGCGGKKSLAMSTAIAEHQKAFLNNPDAEKDFANMQKGTGKWFYYNFLQKNPRLMDDIKMDKFGHRIFIYNNSILTKELNYIEDSEEKIRDNEDYELLSDNHYTFIKDNLSDFAKAGKVTQATTADFVRYFCRKNSYDSLRDHLQNISSDKWDGKSRAKHMFEMLGAKDNEYNNTVAMILLNGLWRRGLLHNDKEVKYDFCVILDGGQGTGKSSFFRVLCQNDDLFTDETTPLGNRNVKMNLSTRWIGELGELRAFHAGQNVLDVKSVLSQTQDTFRFPYDRTPVRMPRRYVFVGTTNKREGYLQDFTGNRRFLPVECAEKEEDGAGRFLNSAETALEREYYFRQLWSEVAHLAKTGELDKYEEIPDHLRAEVKAMQEKKEAKPFEERKVIDYISRKVPADFEKMRLKDFQEYTKWDIEAIELKDREYVCIEEIMDALYGGGVSVKMLNGHKMQIGKILQMHDWVSGSLVDKKELRSYACYKNKVVYYNPMLV